MQLRSLAHADLHGKTVLVRVDYNVPLQKGGIQDLTRLYESLPTLQYLLDQDTKIVLMSHLGRPKGTVDEGLRLKSVGEALSLLLGKTVISLSECRGAEVLATVQSLPVGTVCLLENLRFHPEEEANDPNFAKDLAQLGEIYVNDAFATAHRAHASTEGISHYLPTYAGLLMEKEVKALSSLLASPKRPLCLVVGGAKIDTKIGILEHFIPLADSFVIGGALANTFLKAQGHEVGTSLFEEDKLEVAQSFLDQAKGKSLFLPVDVRVSKSELNEDAPVQDLRLEEVQADMKILDLGPQSIESFQKAILASRTVIWNGPMGLYELAPFSGGTKAIAQAVVNSEAETVLGGGDTLDAIHHFAFKNEQFTHVSTGGGAMLEFLEGKTLPGLKALMA